MKEIRLLTADPEKNQSQQLPLISNTKQQPLLYSTKDFPSVLPQIGDDVICTNFGRGRVVSIRDESGENETIPTTAIKEQQSKESSQPGMVQVELSYWKLAGRSKVMGWFSLQNVRVVQRKVLSEMTNAWERVQYANEIKSTASARFAKKDYLLALESYGQAVDAVRFVQHDSNSANEVRADLVVVMITCCNNAATCCFQLLGMGKDPSSVHTMCERGIQYSKNAVVLIDALYAKRGFKIHTILQQDGLPNSKLFGEWKVKSLFLLGRFYTHLKKYEDAMQHLKQALAIISQYTSSEERSSKDVDPASKKALLSQDRQIRKLLLSLQQKRKAEKKKEKQRAMAMFGSPSKQTDNKENTAKNANFSKAAAPPPSSTPSIETTIATPTKHSDESTASIAANSTPKQPLSALKKTPTDGTNDNIPNSSTSQRRVSFSDVDEVSEFDMDGHKGTNFVDRNFDNINNDNGDEESSDNEPWYQEHLEAMILTGIAVGIGTIAFSLIRSSRK